SGVALVLGGGGLVGHAWHVGVLAALWEVTGWDARRAQLIVGTSAGAVVAAELRAGIHPADLLRPGIGAAPTTAPALAPEAPQSWRPAAPGVAARAVRERAPIALVAAGLLPRGGRDPGVISDAIAALGPGPGWPPGLWVATIRLDDGSRAVAGRGHPGDPQADVPSAVAASCAIPAYFAPVALGAEDHIDGGLRSATNADLVADRSFDVVVVSSPMSLAPGPERPWWPPRPSRLHRLVHHRQLAEELAAVAAPGGVTFAVEPGPGDVAALGPISAAMDHGRRPAATRAGRARAATLLASPQGEQLGAALAPFARSG
ncbi:MAG TPA: patatin-like phospholipase family protein, partial [Acidimicrobiales bacterium]|nr:patatin-like phospholipase family protein [Acidimicrobiales bacterium]